jgi:uncharacterized protein
MSLSPGNAPEEIPEVEAAAQDALVFPRRIPHIGHALLFVCFAGMLMLASEVFLLLLGFAPAAVVGGEIKVQYPKMQIAAMAATYLATLLAAWLFYPLAWHRRFLDGIQWNWAVARRQAVQLIGLGLLVGLMMQIVTYFVTPPKTMPMDEFFLSATTAWVITLFGTALAPAFEEICFRGFLLPAFAIAYDWLSLPRTDEAHERWRTTTTLTPAALIFSALLSSLLFVWIHGEQYAYYWASLLALFSISLLLTFVRVKTQSVAASAMVHAAYNSFVFLVGIIATGGYRHLDRLTK